MNCMKCGQEVKPGEAFCASCLEHMKRYPVKPGTAVVLPSRKESSSAKKPGSRKRILTSDEQISLLKKYNRRLAYLLIVAIVIIAMLGVLSGHVVKQLGVQKFLGQNYSTIVHTEPPSETADETAAQTDIPTT